MSPLDDELAAALRARAGRLDPPGDPLPGIERRARGIRRRRQAATALGAAAVAGVLVVGGGRLVGDGPDRLVPAGPVPTTTSPPAAAEPSPSPAQTTTPTPFVDGPPLGLDAGDPWDFRGDAAVAAGLERRALAEWADAEGYGEPTDDTTGVPLFATTVPVVGDRALLFLARGPGEDQQIVLFTVTPDGSSNLDRRPLPDGVPVVSRVLAGGEVPYVLVLASPAVGQVDYLPDGREPAEPVQAGPGWGVYERTVGRGVPDLVQVYDGDGRLVVSEPLQLGCAEGQCGREPAEEVPAG